MKEERRVGMEALETKVDTVLEGIKDLKESSAKHWEFSNETRDRLGKVEGNVKWIQRIGGAFVTAVAGLGQIRGWWR